MANIKGRPGEYTRDRALRQFWEVMSTDKGMTIREMMHATGRVSNGGFQYLSMMNSLVLSGQAMMEETATRGRCRKEYRKVRDTFYNTMRDHRFEYWSWEGLPDTVKQQATERYAGGYEWLEASDWLYPMTQKETFRLGKSERVLRITIDQAEEKREAWRRRFAGALLQ